MHRAYHNLEAHLRKRVDAAPLRLFQIALGVLLCGRSVTMMAWNVDFFRTSSLLFRYWGFGWLPRPPGAGVYLLLGASVLGGLAMIQGRFARWGAIIGGATFTYVLLLDQSFFGSTNYALCWMLFAASLIPGRVDSPRARTPRWVVWAPRVILVALYFFAGVVKLHADWLHGDVLRLFIAEESILSPSLKAMALAPAVLSGLATAGALFDLTIGWLLVWPRTRGLALAGATVFHLCNIFLVGIWVVPVVILALTWTAFLWPSSARALLRYDSEEPLTPQAAPGAASVVWRVGVLAFMVVHLWLPLRPYLYASESRWGQHAQHFSWWLRSLHTKVDAGFFVVADGERHKVNPLEYIDEEQAAFAANPYLIVQFAHHIAEEWRAKGYEDVAVYGDVEASLNGRPLQRYIPQDLNLAEVDLGFDMTHIVVPMRTDREDPAPTP